MGMAYAFILTVSGIGIAIGIGQVTDPTMDGYGKYVAFILQILLFSGALYGVIYL